MSKRDCKHGGLARTCEICGIEKQLSEVLEREGDLVFALRKVRNALAKSRTPKDESPAEGVSALHFADDVLRRVEHSRKERGIQ